MDGAAKIFGAAAELHHRDALRHQVGGGMRDDVGADDPIRFN